jgi:hypothetical protein
MMWKRAEITPILEKLIIKIDPLFDLGKVSPSSHLSKEFPFIKFEGFTLLKIGTVLYGPDPKTKVGKSTTISIGDGEGNLSRHKSSFLLKIP